MENKTILITGGTGKVGTVLVNHYADKGYNVVFTSRNIRNIEKLKAGRPNVCGVQVDFSQPNAVDEMINNLVESKLDVNYLVNNARNIEALKVEDDGFISPDNWMMEYQIDVVTPYLLSIGLSRTMSLEKIVNISSMYGVNAYNPMLYEGVHRFPLQYACAKASLIHLTKCLAVFFADSGISVNCISLGGILGRVDMAFQERYAKLCPQKRMMEDKEVVGSVDFLISDKSTYMTGENIKVDGGWGIW
ncbi:SDR family oxidoreductase [Bacteroides sp. GD17]|jgi:NAD(P)-dependent dehydrogenase (short-subunit alcohol dehydrogenase family)|uniref:SDR family oxidoreductase n=1 Tax=Bacteroides sp. GD17 TaxID=3139826 RepID=UPI0025D00BFB|nr:SDR family oxidoreductase [uncultured Bacteroides sp.]